MNIEDVEDQIIMAYNQPNDENCLFLLKKKKCLERVHVGN